MAIIFGRWLKPAMLALRYSIQPEPNTMNVFFRQQRGIHGKDCNGSSQVPERAMTKMTRDYLLIRELINLGVPYERINIPGITFETIEI